jgi:6,7-dimethyl-8-ribityllumazine synthase
MYNTYEGKLLSDKAKYAIVISRFNEFITNKMLSGCIDCLNRHSVKEEEIDVYWVPGAFEIPAVAAKIAGKKKHDAIVCVGAVIRGSTPHFDYVCAETSKGIAKVGIDSGIPVVYGILTTDTIEQAIERAGTKSGNKGWSAALSAIELVNLYRSID